MVENQLFYLSSGTESINSDHYLRWMGGWLNLEFSIIILKVLLLQVSHEPTL